MNYSGNLDLAGIVQPQYTSYQNVRPVRTIESVLQNLEFVKNSAPYKFSSEEIGLLLALRWADSSPVLELNQPELVYELTAICVQSPSFQEAYADIQAITRVSVPSLGLELILYLAPFKDEANRFIADIERLKNSNELVIGVESCKKCSSKHTRSIEMQMRSADEPMTRKTICLACGYRWTES